MLTLRDYQIDALKAFDRVRSIGNQSPLFVMPTGAGKTVLFLAMIDRLLQESPSRRALVIAHRKELVLQPEARFNRFFAGKYTTGVISAKAQRFEYDRQITFASKDSLRGKRLARLLANGAIDVIITDEAHHAEAPSYKALYENLKTVNADLLHIGVTATPMRGDKKGLGNVFEPCDWNKNGAAFSLSLRDLIPRYLVVPRWLAIKTGKSLKGVHSAGGDYNQRELADAFEHDDLLKIIVQSHIDHAIDRQALAFTVSVEGAHKLAEEFNNRDIAAAAIDGTMHDDLRSEILRKFDAGETRVLCNCAVLTEGYDNPNVSAIHMARPTKSDSLYLQCIGRGLRPQNGDQPAADETCLIFEYAPAEKRNLAHIGFLFGVSHDEQKKLEDADKALEVVNAELDVGDVLAGFAFDGQIEMAGIGIDGLSIIAMELDYLDNSAWLWHRDHDTGIMSLGLGTSRINGLEMAFLIVKFDDDDYSLFGLTRKPNNEETRAEPYKVYELKRGDFVLVEQEVNRLIDKHGNRALSGKDRQWQKAAASKPQIKFLNRISGKKYKVGAITKGEASQLITHYIALDAYKKSAFYHAH